MEQVNQNDSPESSITNKTSFKFSRTFLIIAILLLFTISIPITVKLTQSKQITKQEAAGGTSVTIDLNTPEGTSQFMPGITHAEDDTGSDTSSGKQLLSSGLLMQNVFIMGWGTDNPEISPGSYDWSTLDPRVQLMRDTGGTMMISLCCAPDWMKGGSAGQTDWSKIEVAPIPSHYADFAELSKQVALRYKDVKYFSV